MRIPGFQRSALACLLLPLATAALAQAQVDPGKRDFETRCAVCHGADGKGAGPFAAQLKQPLPDLTTLAKRNGGAFPADRTFAMIEGAGAGHGGRAMPVWGLDFTTQASEQLPEMPYNQAKFVRERITALVEYLHSLQVK